MELLIVLMIFLLAVCGLATGLLLGRGPVRGSCGGRSCLKNFDCAACPHRETED